MYPELMVVPMREELTRLGIEELRTAAEVDAVLGSRQGTVMVVVNSICGCAAGRLRPAVRRAMQHPVRPSKVVTVFAGQDREATEQARSYFSGYEPSSPSLALFRDGELVFFLERCDIEQREADDIAGELIGAFAKYCAPTVRQ